MATDTFITTQLAVESTPADTFAVPQVSIGMPVYNGEPFISEALVSLLEQTFTNFELIISDNASTDGTESICRNYAAKDKRIRYVRQAENRGALANFQFVLDEALGEYFMWAAADDVWDSQWIAVLLPLAIKFQCLAFGRVAAIDSDGEPIPHQANNRSFNFQGPRLIRRLLYYLAPPFFGKANPIYGLLKKNMISHENFAILGSRTYGSDMLFLFNLLSDVEIRSAPSAALHKRIHPGCAGGFAVVKDKNRQSLFRRLMRAGRSLLVSQVKDYNSYSSISFPIERILFAIFLPAMIALYGLYMVGYFVSPKRSLLKKT